MAPKRRLFELEGLKFEIGKLKVDMTGEEGEQQLRAVTDEITRVIAAPVTQVLRPQLESAAPAPPAAAGLPVALEKRSMRRVSRPRVAANASTVTEAAALDWKPDIQKYGNPTTSWSTAEKGMWLLHCYSKDNGGTASAPKGLSVPVLVATFNQHFPHTKPISSRYLYRDFNKYADGERPKVTVDRTKSPPVWYVAPAGAAAVEELTKQRTAPLLIDGAA